MALMVYQRNLAKMPTKQMGSEACSWGANWMMVLRLVLTCLREANAFTG